MEACGLWMVGEEDQRGSSRFVLLLTGMLRLLRARALRRCSRYKEEAGRVSGG